MNIFDFCISYSYCGGPGIEPLISQRHQVPNRYKRVSCAHSYLSVAPIVELARFLASIFDACT